MTTNNDKYVVQGKLADNERMKERSNFLRGTIEEDLSDDLTGGFSADNFQLIRFHGMYQQDDRDIRAERAKQKCCERNADNQPAILNQNSKQIAQVDFIFIDIRSRVIERTVVHNSAHYGLEMLSAMLMTEIDGNNWLITRFHCEMPAASTNTTSWACSSKRSASNMPVAY